MGLTLLDGNEAIALGAVAAGCDFFAGYPITPATTIYQNMLEKLPPLGGIVLQGEDEIASIGFCLGASMAGKKAMTATSGPGISLYSEQISFAIGSEIPIVIVDVQRLGPSTGSATKGADGDIQFLRWSNSGGLPVIVLAPVDAADCFQLTIQAFNLAEEYRCPVFLASNKEIGMTRETLDMDELGHLEIHGRRMAGNDHPFLPFAPPGDRLTPDFLPIGGRRIVRQTSSTHGPEGYITTDPEQIARNQDRLDQKLSTEIEKFSYFEELPKAGAETLIITYGVTARSAKAALRMLEAEGLAASLLVLKTLWPVPEALIRQKAGAYRRIVVAEMNLGQYVREIRRVLPDREVFFLGKMNGDLVHPRRIKEVVTHG